MKKNLLSIGIISLLLIIGMVFIGCESGGSPSGVIRSLHSAIEKGNKEEIVKLMTAESSALVLKMLPELQKSYAESGGIAKVEHTINGNTAVVKVTYKNGGTDDYDLIKENEKWKATIKLK